MSQVYYRIQLPATLGVLVPLVPTIVGDAVEAKGLEVVVQCR
jgi:hypothetical protein